MAYREPCYRPLTLAEMIAAVACDEVDRFMLDPRRYDIDPDRFTTQGVEVVGVPQIYGQSYEALRDISGLGMRPASIEHFLAYCAEHPEEEGPLVALGSWTYDYSDLPDYPFLRTYRHGLFKRRKKRILRTLWAGNAWPWDLRFLVVRD